MRRYSNERFLLSFHWSSLNFYVCSTLVLNGDCWYIRTSKKLRMGGCSAPNCTNASRKGFRCFSFPADPERRMLWRINTRRDDWIPTRAAKLCEVCDYLIVILFSCSRITLTEFSVFILLENIYLDPPFDVKTTYPLASRSTLDWLLLTHQTMSRSDDVCVI